MSQMILGGNGGGDNDIELASLVTKKSLEQLVVQLLKNLPENARNSCWQTLSEHQKQFFQTKL